MLVHCRSLPAICWVSPTICPYPFIPGRRTKCLTRKHNTISLTRARTRTPRSEVERINQEKLYVQLHVVSLWFFLFWYFLYRHLDSISHWLDRVDCNSQSLLLCNTTLYDWLKISGSLSHPIRIKTRTKRISPVQFFLCWLHVFDSGFDCFIVSLVSCVTGPSKLKNSSLLRMKNAKKIIINHKGTRMIKDGED